jgi:hypothetical protein
VVALVVLGLFVAIIIGALYLSQSSSTAALGRRLEELISERNTLEQTNEQLRAEIANLQRVGRLLQRAEELGFRPADGSVMDYIVVAGYNPNRNLVIAPILVEPQPALPAYEESFIGWVQQQFDDFRRQVESLTQEGS